MKGQTVARILLIMLLIIAAHIIKPFSIGNVVGYVLSTSSSLASILPDTAREGFYQANFLAVTLSDSLLKEKEGDIVTTDAVSFDINGVIAGRFADAPETTPAGSKIPVNQSRKVNALERGNGVPTDVALNNDLAESHELPGENGLVAEVSESGPDESEANSPGPVEPKGEAVWNMATPIPAAREASFGRFQRARFESLNLEPLINQGLSAPVRSFCRQVDPETVRMIAIEEAFKGRIRVVPAPNVLEIPLPNCDEQSNESSTEQTPAVPVMIIRSQRPLSIPDNCN